MVAHTQTLAVFESAVQDAYAWVAEIQRELEWEDPHHALAALRGVLHALRDRLPANEAAHLSAQLPLLIRGLYYENYRPAHAPVRERHAEAFLAHVRASFGPVGDLMDLDEIARAVVQVLTRHLSPGEQRHVVSALPKEVRELWPT